MTLLELDGLYDVAARLNVTRVIVPDARVDEFTLATRELEKVLGTDAGEEPWLTALAPLRKARWVLHTVPLPSPHPALGLDALAAQLAISGRLLASGGSEQLKHWLEAALGELQVLSAEESTALADTVAEALEDGADVTATIVLLNAPFLRPVTEYFANQPVPPKAVLTPAVLRRHPAHESQLVIGPSRNYPDWLWTAPRAEVITILHRASATDRDHIRSTLPVGGQPSITIRGDKQSRLIAKGFTVEPPPINWSSLTKVGHGAPKADDVRARAYLLAGQHAVLLEAADGATAFIVDPNGRGEEMIGRIPTSAVDVGNFLLLRESFGDEDVIVKLANLVLGGRAGTLRQQQERWKKALRTAVFRDGVTLAYKRLEALGCRARNMARWLGPDAIRTQSRTDFDAICSYGGLPEGESATLWTGMAEIASAHIKAGHQMRELLEKRLTQTDLSPLLVEGRLTINLPEIDAGALGIFRVDARDGEICMVNPRELRVAVKARSL